MTKPTKAAKPQAVSVIGRVKRDRKRRVWRLWLERGAVHFARQHLLFPQRDEFGIYFADLAAACAALQAVSEEYARQPHHQNA